MTLTKLDLKHDLRPLYAAGLTPRIVDVPCLRYLMLDGHGDPNTTAGYAAAVKAIYAVAYAVKSMVRQAEGVDFSVMPLEGLWWSAEKIPYSAGDRANWDWTLMIAQPEFVTAELLADVRECAALKSSPEVVAAVRFGTLCEGPCAQVMHIGPYEDEASVVARLRDFIACNGRAPVGRHHEIYLSDPNRTAPQRLKTVIRQPIAVAAA
ncbi:MAG TPA: GyrI-like domain-containing protein [Frankiaceae bacterium]|nr:GyrI-like domain-containing protein [Frankiaceae bacterium]